MEQIVFNVDQKTKSRMEKINIFVSTGGRIVLVCIAFLLIMIPISNLLILEFDPEGVFVSYGPELDMFFVDLMLFSTAFIIFLCAMMQTNADIGFRSGEIMVLHGNQINYNMERYINRNLFSTEYVIFLDQAKYKIQHKKKRIIFTDGFFVHNRNEPINPLMKPADKKLIIYDYWVPSLINILEIYYAETIE